MQWLLLLLILAGLPWLYVLVNRYVLYPWRARNDPLEVEPVHTPIELTTVSPEAAERLTAVARELASCGFIAAAHSRIEPSPSMPNREAYLSIWLDRREGIVSRVIWMRTSNPSVRYVMTCLSLAFTTTFDDGWEVVTTNASIVSAFPPHPMTDALGWQGMNHPSMLCKLHRARVERVRAGRQTVMPAPGAAGIESLEREPQRRFIEHLIRRGYARRDARGGLGKTLRGSYLTVWRILWPWKQWTVARHARKLRRILADLPELASEARSLPPSPPATHEQMG